MQIILDKTKCMAIGKADDTIQIKVDNKPLEFMEVLAVFWAKLEAVTRKS